MPPKPSPPINAFVLKIEYRAWASFWGGAPAPLLEARNRRSAGGSAGARRDPVRPPQPPGPAAGLRELGPHRALRARFSGDVSPKQIEDRLLDAITVPTRYPPSVSLEELDADGVVLRIMATPLRPEEGSKLADEVLAALREVGAPQLA